ncbi:MAG: hypothetical protein K0R57_1192 [Paenibacillaceae bacterium]|nr:hypothetical protein [Paenibacillaceae bacterium]
MAMLTITSASTVMIDLEREAHTYTALKAAAADLARDLRSCIGCMTGLKDGEGPVEGQALRILIRMDGEAFPERSGTFGQREQYRYSLDADGLTITGSDLLGAIWGVYNISEEYLGVNPFAPLLERPPGRWEQYPSRRQRHHVLLCSHTGVGFSTMRTSSPAGASQQGSEVWTTCSTAAL